MYNYKCIYREKENKTNKYNVLILKYSYFQKDTVPVVFKQHGGQHKRGGDDVIEVEVAVVALVERAVFQCWVATVEPFFCGVTDVTGV